MARAVIKDLDDLKLKKGIKANKQANEGNSKKVLFQMNITEKDKNALKAFFASQGVSMTDGLIKCFYFVKNEVENGKAEITRGGIFSK